jgi:DNA-binding GntR family transcriptional regulator
MAAVRLGAQIAEELRRQIRDGVIGPGDCVLESALAEDAKRSIATVRHALMELDDEGLLSRSPRKGAVVQNFTRNEVRERIEIRSPLEIIACQRAAVHLKDRDYDELEQIIELMGVDNDADRRFHHLIWRHAHQATLERTLKTVVSPLFTFVPLTRVVLTNQVERIDAHRKLVAAIRSGDLEAIAEEVRRHLYGAYFHFFSSKWPDFRSMYEAVRSGTIGNTPGA